MITDDELLLYYYRELDAGGARAHRRGAQPNKPELAQRLHRLVARLDAAAATPDVPVPAAIPAALGNGVGSRGAARGARDRAPPGVRATEVAGRRGRGDRGLRRGHHAHAMQPAVVDGPQIAANRDPRWSTEERHAVRERAQVPSREHGAPLAAWVKRRRRNARAWSKPSSARTASTRWRRNAPASRSWRECCAPSRRFSKTWPRAAASRRRAIWRS